MECFFTPATEPASEAGYPPEGPLKFMLFDLDATLVVSMSGQLFAATKDDCVCLPGVKARIAALRSDGWQVLIVTNQLAGRPGAPGSPVSQKLAFIAQALGVPVLAALGPGEYRKPSPALWQAFRERAGIGAERVSELVFCGDAAGPEASDWPPYQWSGADSGFASAVGARFLTPDVVFPRELGARLDEPQAVPGSLLPFIEAATRGVRWLLILVGNPGCGKSRLGRALHAAAPGAVAHVSRDAFRSQGPYLQAVTAALAAGCAVADATNAAPARRQELYVRAEATGAMPVVAWILRDGRPFNARRPEGERVPAVAYSGYTKRFGDPRADAPAARVIRLA